MSENYEWKLWVKIMSENYEWKLSASISITQKMWDLYVYWRIQKHAPGPGHH